jgi:hypothetical protein
VTTSWSIPNSPPGGPQADSLRAVLFLRLNSSKFSKSAVYYSVIIQMADPAHQRQRLREEYSRTMDGELERITLDEADLTDDARHALQEEMSLRGLLPQSFEARAGEADLSSAIPVACLCS